MIYTLTISAIVLFVVFASIINYLATGVIFRIGPGNVGIFWCATLGLTGTGTMMVAFACVPF